MNFQKISEDVFYVGVNDRTTHLFEGMWPLPVENGTKSRIRGLLI